MKRSGPNRIGIADFLITQDLKGGSPSLFQSRIPCGEAGSETCDSGWLVMNSTLHSFGDRLGEEEEV